MGKQDSVQKIYWEDNRRFADLFNTVLGEGECLISEADIQEENTVYSDVKKQGDKKETDNYIRDVIKKVTKNMTCFLVGIEDQNHIHYGMPARVMSWDGQAYLKQMKQLYFVHRTEGDLKNTDEFLSGMKKTERLKPVCTIVLYFGEKEWDGPRDLYDMLNMDGIPERLKGKFANYPMILVDVPRFSEWDKFQTDLREVFGFIYHSNSGQQMERFLEENKEKLSTLEEDACDFVEVVTGSKELEKFRLEKKEVRGNMCRALEEMKEAARKEGIKEGIKEAIGLMAKTMLEEGVACEQICDMVMRTYGMSLEEVEVCIRG